MVGKVVKGLFGRKGVQGTTWLGRGKREYVVGKEYKEPC